MSNSTLMCAQNSDGTLREASEIQFFHDVDDQHPISGPSAAGSSSSPTHPFFTGTARPVGKIAGSRRSARQPRPSARISDPNNVEGSGSRSGKRKQASPAPAARKARRISTILSDAESSEDSEGPNDSDAAPLEDTEADDTDGQDAMDVDHYESIKAMGDADHARITSKLSRSDTTADINTVFTRMKDRKNPRTGVLESGALCQVCQKSGLPDSSCFLTGSVTTLRKHIARHDDHFKVYKTRCEKLGIKMNDRAIPVAASGTLGTQGSLDGIVIYEPRTPPFTVAGHRDYIIEMIVTQDEALSLVERPSFIRLIKYLRPGIKDSDIPTRNTIKKDILQHAKRVEEELRDKFKEIPGKISIAHDAWTSGSGIPFMNINGHHIYAHPDRPNDWEIVTDELAFMKLDGRHTGETLGNAIIETVDRYDFRDKFGWGTADGARRTPKSTCSHVSITSNRSPLKGVPSDSD